LLSRRFRNPTISNGRTWDLAASEGISKEDCGQPVPVAR
jgi:hypothetical protein